MSEGLRVECVPARLSAGRDTGISFLGEGEEHSVPCSRVGALRTKPKVQRVESWYQGYWEAEITAALPELQGSRSLPILFSSLFVMALQDSVAASCPPLLVGPGFPRLPQTRVFFSLPGGWKSSQSSVCPLHLRVRGVHTTPHPISTARKTSMD